MASGTYTVACNAGGYTQLTTASSGYALIYNPSSAGVLAIHIGASAPSAAVTTKIHLNPDEAFPRTSDIDNHIWGKYIDGSYSVVVVEDQA